MDLTPFVARLAAHWSWAEIEINVLVFMNLLGALLLGSLVGYERSYRGRAAGMRTYGLVCMASTALIMVAGYPAHWFGGIAGTALPADPTRVMQGIVTGIGFLCAGVMVKEGLNISGLTTAASIWAASCIGMFIGVGFYAAAMLLASISASVMMWGGRIESWLPSHPALRLVLGLRTGIDPPMADLRTLLHDLGYEFAPGSFSFAAHDGATEMRFVAVARDGHRAAPLAEIARALNLRADLAHWTLEHARN
jgi:putative Mg2+ transporter-C (MgtC) family protein